MPCGNILKRHPLIVGIVAFALSIIGLDHLPIPGGDTYWGAALTRVILGAFLLAVMALQGGLASIHPSGKGMGYGLRKTLYLLAWAAAFGIIMTFAYVVQSGSSGGLPAGWLFQALGATVMCITVGIFEEGLFRGVLFGSLLAKMGSTRKGVAWAVAISSTIFGFVHVMPNLLAGDLVTPLAWAQALCKTFLSTGIFGAIMAVIYLRTRNIWVVALIHCVNDLFTTVPPSIMSGSFNVNYVDTDPSAGMIAVVAFLVMFFVMYLPMLIWSIRVLKGISIPQRGPCVESWEPRTPNPDPKRPRRHGAKTGSSDRRDDTEKEREDA